MDVSSLAVSAMAPQSVSPVSQTAMPSDIVADRFNAMMSAGSVTPSTAMPVLHNIHPTSSTNALQEPQSLGSQILSGLNHASDNYAQKWKNVTSALDNMTSHPSASSMLKIQSELLQVSLQYELVSKAVSRSTQNIDTLVRMS